MDLPERFFPAVFTYPLFNLHTLRISPIWCILFVRRHKTARSKCDYNDVHLLSLLRLLHSQAGNKLSEDWLSALSSDTRWLLCSHIDIYFFTVHGVCYNLPSGDNTIDLRTETNNSSMYVGKFSRASRLYVDELSIRSTTYSSEPAVASCPGLSFFNTREFAHNGVQHDDPNTELFVST